MFEQDIFEYLDSQQDPYMTYSETDEDYLLESGDDFEPYDWMH